VQPLPLGSVAEHARRAGAQQVSAAAVNAAFQARARLRQVRDEIAQRLDVPGTTWREMDMLGRTLLVELVFGSTKGPAEVVARKAWGWFSESERISLAGTANTLRRIFAQAGGLSR